MKSSVHHKAIGDKSSRLLINAAKIIKIITEQGNPLLKSDMFNLATENISRDIGEQDNFWKDGIG